MGTAVSLSGAPVFDPFTKMTTITFLAPALAAGTRESVCVREREASPRVLWGGWAFSYKRGTPTAGVQTITVKYVPTQRSASISITYAPRPLESTQADRIKPF